MRPGSFTREKTGGRLFAEREPIGEPLREAGVDDLILRGPDVVFDPAQFDELLVGREKAVGGVPVAVARLADAADS